MKKLAVLLGCLAMLVTEFALANATATSVTGSVQAQAGSAPARVVRLGDTLRQGDTVVVLRFEDGQIAALAANSRMAITTYTFNSQARTGNVLLSLIDGGMRAVTGLIGRSAPANVAYRARSATIGIRGTDSNVVIGPNGVVATVNDGAISFALPGQDPVVITAGEGVFARNDGTLTRGAIQQIANQLAQAPGGDAILAALNGLQGLSALLGVPPPGPAPASGLVTSPGPPSGGASSAGGGGASAR
jgi:hypothetical protein